MGIERTVIALGLSALLYAQAPGVFDTLEADGDARFNGDVVFTTPSGALVSFQSLVNAGVGLPMTVDSDTSTQGFQCPSGMNELTALRGRFPIGVTTNGTLGADLGTAYADSDGPVRRGGTAQTITATFSGSGITIGSHSHGFSDSATIGSHSHGFSDSATIGSHSHGFSASHGHASGEHQHGYINDGFGGVTVSTGGATTTSVANDTFQVTNTGFATDTVGSATVSGTTGSGGGGTVNVSGTTGSGGGGTVNVSGTTGSGGGSSLTPSGSVSVTNVADQPPPAPAVQVLWCVFA